MGTREVISHMDDDGTMPRNVDELEAAVVGHKIVSAEKATIKRDINGLFPYEQQAFVITLDNGLRAALFNTDDCCAYTELEAFLLHPDMVDHVITGIRTECGYTVWHIHADLGDVLTLTVGWSAGNPFYYGYGFDIRVIKPEDILSEVVQ